MNWTHGEPINVSHLHSTDPRTPEKAPILAKSNPPTAEADDFPLPPAFGNQLILISDYFRTRS
jgi:hypothetical protein